MLLEASVQLAMRETQLDPGDEVLGADVRDLTHQPRIQPDASLSGDSVPLEAASGSEGHHEGAAFVDETQDLHGFVTPLRGDDVVRRMRSA
jgi:hypothetical protein